MKGKFLMNTNKKMFRAIYAGVIVLIAAAIIIGNIDKKRKEEASQAVRAATQIAASSTAPKAKADIDFHDLNWDSNNLYTVATGSVKNSGDVTIYYLEIKVAFKNSSGNVVDTDWTYAAGSEGLAPGESTKWRCSVTKDSSIKTYTVSVIDYRLY